MTLLPSFYSEHLFFFSLIFFPCLPFIFLLQSAANGFGVQRSSVHLKVKIPKVCKSESFKKIRCVEIVYTRRAWWEQSGNSAGR